MAHGSIRRSDIQAKWAFLFSLTALVLVVMLAALLFRNLNLQLKVIGFGAESLYKPTVLGITASALFLGAIGAVLGISSAGERRNPFQKRSWAGFFLGSTALSLTLILFYAFWTLQMSQQTAQGG